MKDTISIACVILAQEDVGIMEDIGFDAYRFSISWSRMLPSKLYNLSSKKVSYIIIYKKKKSKLYNRQNAS